MRLRDTDVNVVMVPGGAGDDLAAGRMRAASEAELRQTVRRLLGEAESAGTSSLAFAAADCRGVGLTLLASAKVAAQEVFRHLRPGGSAIRRVDFLVCDDAQREAFEKGALRYLEHIVGELGWGPFVTVDGIIERDGGVVLIQRSNPPFGWALPGGFVDYGESLEDAVRREVREETNLTARGLRQFHTYSDPQRDPRFHTIGTVFVVEAAGELRAGDDAAGARVVPWHELDALDMAFDHKRILLDYRGSR